VQNLGVSRVERIKVDPWNGTATLEQTWNQPSGLVASSQGNAQTTGDGNLAVSWGNLPFFSEFDQQGDLLFNAEFPEGVNTYRAYQFPWPPSNTGGGGNGGGSGGSGGNGGGPGGPGGPGSGPGAGGEHHHRRHHPHHHQGRSTHGGDASKGGNGKNRTSYSSYGKGRH